MTKKMFEKAYERGNPQFWLNRTTPRMKKEEIFGEKQDKELAESFKQSKKNKKERLDNEKKKNKANEDNRKDDWIWT
tara:strand:- start:681 stop:911 length:231 start_codon:yes stop_codon:yes gene_type:complete